MAESLSGDRMTLPVRNRPPGLVGTEGHAGWMAWGGEEKNESGDRIGREALLGKGKNEAGVGIGKEELLGG